MKTKMIGVLVATVFVSNVAVAGPAGLVEKVIEKGGDVAVSMTNSITGGVTSKEGKVTAKGVVGGKLTNVANGEGATAKTNIGSNKGVTAKGDISAHGVVGGDVTNVANGKNSTAVTTVGGNGE